MGCKVAVARNGIYSGVNLFILSLFEAVVKTDCWESEITDYVYISP